MINIFDKKETEALIALINKLTSETKPLWGKMSMDQMLGQAD